VNQPPLNNPNARHWDDLVEDFGFTPDEQEGTPSGLARTGLPRSPVAPAVGLYLLKLAHRCW
jgi:hypothetical protein